MSVVVVAVVVICLLVVRTIMIHRLTVSENGQPDQQALSVNLLRTDGTLARVSEASYDERRPEQPGGAFSLTEDELVALVTLTDLKYRWGHSSRAEPALPGPAHGGWKRQSRRFHLPRPNIRPKRSANEPPVSSWASTP